jgi:Spy/CpxP family protein refolding chaperone
MKVRFALLASLAVLAAPLAAQGGQGMRMGGGMMGTPPSIDTLSAQLALTAEQKPKVEAALAAYTESTKDAREFMTKAMAGGGMAGMRDNPEAMKHLTTIREARTKLATDIKAAVTPEQAAKYDELYPQRMGRRPGT